MSTFNKGTAQITTDALVSVDTTSTQMSDLQTQIDALQAQRDKLKADRKALEAKQAAIPAVVPISQGFKAGTAYQCVTSTTTQFTVGESYLGVRTGTISEMDPNTGLVSDRARVFNKTKSTFVPVGQWCNKPTRKVS